MNEHLLSMNIFIPLLGILAITSASKKREDIIKIIAAITTGLQMWIALQIFFNFDRTKSGIQFVEHYSWIKTFSIDYFLGIDGLNFPLVLLTALILFISVFASWKLKKGVKGYFILFLLLDMGLMGVFTSMDLFLFLIFFGLTLFPTYLLIGIWGNSQSENTAIKYALFSVFSYVLILLGILLLYFKSDPNTFNILELIPNANFPLSFQIMTFLILFIGFAALIPIFPFHTWLISVLTKAPTAVSIIIVSILIKIGTYGLIRICLPILPSASIGFALPLSIIAIINIIYGALCALGQNDLKKIVGYFSISQMGFILLGFASVIGGVSGRTNAAITGISGSLFHMFNHGTVAALLLLLTGVIYNRTSQKDISKVGGLSSKMPVFSGITALALFAGFGLPGLSTFISEMFCIIGSFQIPGIQVLSIISITGIILNAAYFFRCFQLILYSKENPKYTELQDIKGNELFMVIPFVLIIILLGIYPNLIFNIMTQSVEKLVEIVTVGVSIIN